MLGGPPNSSQTSSICWAQVSGGVLSGAGRGLTTMMRFPLATYRYRSSEASCRTHLGFVIEDVEPSPSVDASHDFVDLYGYTTMAVAALQTQARQIEILERDLGALRSELETMRRERDGGSRLPSRR